MKPAIQSLTPRQLEILRIVADFQTVRCYSPTIGELAGQMGLSRTTAFEHISELRKKGLLSTSTGKARCLTLTAKACELLEAAGQPPANQPDSPQGIPLAGTVAAGLPVEAVQDNNCLSFSSVFGRADDMFALEVRGDSMVEDGIREGDYVICRQASTADNGQLVVAIVDNEHATVKRFFRDRHAVRLQPANKDYQPIYSDNCRIQAVVVGLLRKL